MRAGVPYAGAELEVYDNAMRLVPAVLKARAEGRPDDVHTLFKGLLDDGAERGVCFAMAWSIYASAATAWCQQLFEAQARDEDAPVVEVLDRAIIAAADWAARAQ